MSGSSQQALLNLGVLDAQAAGAPGGDPGGDDEGSGTAPGTAAGGPLSPVSAGAAGSALFPGSNGSCEQTSGSNVRINTACTNYADAALSGRS
ncbi:MAG TPA: hypothetical protein VFO60_07550, partial [Candidatus Dormibacteraeota bacterium]|nr:hypothetical protein [Candidatus Dormibacteraeota bacterium]